MADARLPCELVTLLLISQQTTQEDPGSALHTVGPCKNYGIASYFRPAVENLDPAPVEIITFYELFMDSYPLVGLKPSSGVIIIGNVK